MNKKLSKILIFSIIGIVFLFSVGYSVLNKNLTVSGELTYRQKVDIRITNVTQKTLTNATLQYIDYSKKEIKLGYTSSGAATIEYTVEVTNFTSTEVGILAIEGLPTYGSVSGYTLKSKLTSGTSALTAGKSTTFVISIKPTTAKQEALTLKFNFQPMRKVTYDGFSSTTGYKTEIINGDTYSQNFGTNGPGAVYITMGGSAVSNYTYTNKTLTIGGTVTGDIVIKVLTASRLSYDSSTTKLGCDGTKCCEDVQCAIDELNKIIDNGFK